MLGLGGAILSQFDNVHGAVLNLGDLGIGDPLDVAIAHLAFEQALGIAHPVQTKVADIGLGSNEGHRHTITNLAATQFGFDDHGEFIGRAIAGRALRRADDDRLRIGGQAFKRIGGIAGMIGAADRCRESIGAQPFDLVKGQIGSGSDHEIVIRLRAAIVQLDPVFGWMDPFGANRGEADSLFRHHGWQVNLDCIRFAPAHRNPGV
jgi:hypothetical protein